MGAEPGGTAPAHDAASSVLSDIEVRVLRGLRESPELPIEETECARRLGKEPDVVRGTLQRLRSKHLAVVDEEASTRLRLTGRGEDALERGLPERRLFEAIRESAEALAPSEVDRLGLSDEERSAAIGILRRRDVLGPGVPFRLRPDLDAAGVVFPEEDVLRRARAEEKVPPELMEVLRRRGLLTVEHFTIKRWRPSGEGERLPLPAPGEGTFGALTPELLASGDWSRGLFRAYDVRTEVPYVTGARPHPYRAWIQSFEEILLGLGFEQAEGPLVETEFWNADVLFMPQEHPARSIHDVFFVRDLEGKLPATPLVEAVAAVHEGRALPGDSAALSAGWGSPYDEGIARRCVLRSQTTAVSARFLARRPAPPFRMYSLDRNFRWEALDATHHIEFEQCEGILGEGGTNLRGLIGTFRAIAEGLGIRDLRVRPSYFPFTEPSVEGYVRHPRLGWIEIFPGGLFRPEVLRPLGIDVPVAAWGIGITRLALVALGVNDIRELFDDDLDRLRGAPS